MKIVHISTFDVQGGAARAAYRLHLGLQRIGQESLMIVRYKTSTDDSVLRIVDEGTTEVRRKAILLEEVIQPYFIDTHRSDFGNTVFSLPYPGYGLEALPQMQAADVINLHWIAYYQSPITLQNLFAMGKPVIWTLHDQWSFTGGCHYTAGCLKFRQDCVACPQLAGDAYDVPAAVLEDRRAYLRDANLTIVTPSRWLAACAKDSKLFKHLRVEVIPYSLDTNVYRPMPKPEAKAVFGIAADTVTLLFSAQNGKEKRKGFHMLQEAVRLCLVDPIFQQLVAENRVKALCLGHPSDELAQIGIPIDALGYKDSDEGIRLAYAASDVFILPSLEDNLPNTLLEAMSCGTPVIGSQVGGIPDLVIDGVTGFLVPPADAQRLCETILSAIRDPDQLAAMGRQGRDLIEQGYALEVQAKHYLDLYEELCKDNRVFKPASLGLSDFTETSRQADENSAILNAEVGPNFERIYEPILFEALKDFTPIVYEKWQASESDRVARLQVIEEQGRRLGEIEAERNNLRYELADLRQHLERSEADRAARLTVIEEQGRQISELEVERNSLQVELDSARQQIQTDTAQLRAYQQLFQAIQSTRVYKAMRRLERWKRIK